VDGWLNSVGPDWVGVEDRAPPNAPNMGLAGVADVAAAACPVFDCADPKPPKPAGVDVTAVAPVPLL
jgi:hypothetical protein